MKDPEQYFFHFGRTRYKEKRSGVHLKAITGERSQLCLIELAPGTETRHTHDHEQIGYILSGKVSLSIAGITASLGPGDGYRIPANTGVHRSLLPAEGGERTMIQRRCVSTQGRHQRMMAKWCLSRKPC